jgi:hypothetical protein
VDALHFRKAIEKQLLIKQFGGWRSETRNSKRGAGALELREDKIWRFSLGGSVVLYARQAMRLTSPNARPRFSITLSGAFPITINSDHSGNFF